MVTSKAALPPMDQIFIIGTWVETLLYGVNCVMYGLCMFILLRGGKVPRARRMLVVMSTILFLLCTVHVGASLRQWLEAFVYAPADIPDYSTIYWLDHTKPMAVLKRSVCATLILLQYCILIWRLYVIFMCDWRVLVLPIILLVGCIGALYAIVIVSALTGATLHDSTLSPLVDVAWSLDMVLNMSVTAAISIRLWRLDRTMASLVPTRSNQYATSIYVIIESGAIFMINNVLILVFYVSRNPATSTLLDAVSQSAALTQFLIVVQVGVTGRYRVLRVPDDDPSTTPLEEMVFRERFEKEDLQCSALYASPTERDRDAAP